jgi:hypothetical protein
MYNYSLQPQITDELTSSLASFVHGLEATLNSAHLLYKRNSLVTSLTTAMSTQVIMTEYLGTNGACDNLTVGIVSK